MRLKGASLLGQFSAKIAAAIVCGAALAAGCFATKQSNSLLNSSNTSNSTSSGIILVNALKNVASPSTLIDLIGDGSGQFGALCTTATSCTCSFDYVTTDGARQIIDAATSYVENDLVRCEYGSVPADVTLINTSLHVIATELFSNVVVFDRTDGTTGNSSSTIQSFTTIQRFQCKDTVFIPHLFDGNMYDPIQSQDPNISYPLNFYTNNMAGSFARYVGKGVKNWNCPAVPNDPNEGMDLSIYSVGPTTGTGTLPGTLADYPWLTTLSLSRTMYPRTLLPAPQFDRSSFLLSKTTLGVFNVPVRSYVAPQVLSVGDVPAIGYGARPVISGGVEACPTTSISLPTGYHWVKLWLFRASLDPRAYYTSPKISEAENIGCYPGKWQPSDTTTVPDCGASTNSINRAGFNGDTELADRIIKNLASNGGMCVNVDVPAPASCSAGSRTGAGCTTVNATTYNVAVTGSDLYAFGSDIWEPRRTAVAGNPFTCSGAPGALNPMNLCTIPAGSTPTTANVPRDEAPVAVNLDENVTRYDFLFVTTPTSITTTQMQAEGADVQAFIPRRYRSVNDCPAQDPDDPSCDINRWIIYGLKLHGVDIPEDPSGGDPTRAGDFPLCVVQKD